MKLVWTVLFIALLSPKGFAQSSEENQFDATPTIVDVDSPNGTSTIRGELEQAAQVTDPAVEEKHRSDLKAEANTYAREVRAAEAKAKREAAQAIRESQRTKQQAKFLQKNMKNAILRTAIAEKKIKRSEKVIAQAQLHRKVLLTQKAAADKKLKVIAAKAQSTERAVRQATLAVKTAEAQARVSKHQVQLAQLKYQKAQRLAHHKIQHSKVQVAKYKSDTLKYKSEKRKLDRSIATMAGDE